MNIDDPTVQALAEEIASRTGRSVTQVIHQALLAQKEDIEREVTSRIFNPIERQAQIRLAAEEIRRAPAIGPWADHDELLYGADGLPR